MDFQNFEIDEPVLYDLNGLRYASIYQVKFKSELTYVYIEYNSYYPTFEEFIKSVMNTFFMKLMLKSYLTKVKKQFKIEDVLEINVKDDKDCKIPNALAFGYFMQNVFSQQTIFEITINQDNINESAVVVPISILDPEGQYQPIYKNPDKFFIDYLSKDLVHFFKNQTEIICSPTGADLIAKYHIAKTARLEIAHKNVIIQISANHLMLVKHNQPTVHDRVIWAKVICEIFTQLRDVNSDEYYFAVYNPNRGDGFLGNRIKLLLKTAKKVKRNQLEVEKHNKPPTTVENQEYNLIAANLQDMVNFMKTADVSTDLVSIIECHKKTFSIRQQYRRISDIGKLILDFPRFFDVDGLIDDEFARMYPLSGLATFTQEVQAKILNIAQESNNYHKFPSTHKNLEQPLDALLHLIILLPPTSLGRGQKNRIKIEQAFPRLVKIQEVFQPLMDITKDNLDKSPFIVVSDLVDHVEKHYYVVFDNQFIKCQSAFCAFDILFKVHYIFGATFDSNVRHVLAFVGYYFYNIKNVTPTSQMRLLNSRLLTN